MPINIARYYKRERLELDCEIVTPMFLGDAHQEAKMRAAPFKGLLRYWWRVAEGSKYPTPESLLKVENQLFGSPDEEHGGKSRVTLEVAPLSQLTAKKDSFASPGKVAHPECEKTGRKTDPLNYLAGMGLIHFRNGIQHSYFTPGEEFRLCVTVGREAEPSVREALKLISAFGAIGSRSRNGWGCFAWDDKMDISRYSTRKLVDAIDRDYPHCLGRDTSGPLLWKTMKPQSRWENCMKDLAEIYISIRAGNAQKQIAKLEVNAGNPPDRHLLGYPITNHNQVWWGSQARHGSALRLIVRKEDGGHRGYILHLPHLFSKKMWPNGKDRQIEIWKKVHAGLDNLCQRVVVEEAQQ